MPDRLETTLPVGDVEQHFLLRLNDRLSALADPEQLKFEAARALGEHLGASRVGYAEMLADGATSLVTRNYTDGVPSIEGRYCVDEHSRALLAGLRAGRTIVRSDVARDPELSLDEKAAHEALQVGASVDVPLVRAGRVVGMLFTHRRHPHPWTAEELALLEMVGTRTWDALERARAEAALRESEARLRLALEIAELGTWSWNLDTGTGDLDPRGAEIVGIPPGDLSNVAEAQLASIHPADLSGVQAAIALGIADGRAFDLAYRVRSPGGGVRHVASRARVVGETAGRAVRIVGTNRDVTAEREAEARLRESEERYRTLVENIDEAFCVLEVLFDGAQRAVDFQVISTNRAFGQQTGLADLVGRRISEVLPGLEPRWLQEYGRVVRTGEAARFQAPIAALGRWYDIYAVRLGDARERRLAVLFNDISARRHAEAERERLLSDAEAARAQAESARLEAEAANRAKSEFLAVMSHELRTPLNAIGGYAELMEMGLRGPVTDQQREDLHRVQASQRHLLGLINEVLNYAKLETGTVRYDLMSVGMRDALAGAYELVAPQAEAKGLTLVVVDCATELAVRADAEKLRQIVVNLLSNAVKFTAQGGRIELRCEVVQGDVSVHVRDTGIGVPSDQLQRIFEPFVQVRSNLTRTAEGTGLGLAISRDLARAMGGDVTVESQEGRGSTFTLILPAA